ncbi:hypothetical protein BY458DRAFT_191523 [Sporodiniella umbellata]|nr:hypothetical protein BY458DRAFT_191523 [Sporodiniella umbellata]
MDGYTQITWFGFFCMPILYIQETYLSCSPSSLLPEKTHLNSYVNAEKHKTISLYCSFRLLYDIEHKEIIKGLNVACLYKCKGQYFQTETYGIEWRTSNDIGWTNSISETSSLVQAFFPCRIMFKKKMTMIQLQNTLGNEWQVIADGYLLLKDQTCIIHLFKSKYLVIHGLLESVVLRTASLFRGCLSSETTNCDERDTIISLGGLAAANENFIKARAKLAINLSALS